MLIRRVMNPLPHPPPLDYSHTPLSVSFSLRYDRVLSYSCYVRCAAAVELCGSSASDYLFVWVSTEIRRRFYTGNRGAHVITADFSNYVRLTLLRVITRVAVTTMPEENVREN